MKILVFGNVLVKKDSLAGRVVKKLAGKLENVHFIECDTSENIEQFGPNLLILDVAFGIDKVELLDGIEMIEIIHPHSLHDFDLGLTLHLLMKMGKIKSVKIIAIPVNYDKVKKMEEIGEEVKLILEKIK
ncbi:MAG: hypothetical protein WCT31_02505 [Candidatus Micrarchaeia archaeon]|jgi:Ni,Fe-hydrogenase maturation factor